MKKQILCLVAVCCATAILALAQNTGLEGTWITEGVPAVEAAIKAKKSLNGLPEGTKIKFKADTKKGKVSGSITQLNTDKEFEIADGKLTDKTFTFNSVEIVALGFGNNRGGGNNAQQPVSIPWKGELTDANTVTLTRLSATGEPVSTLVLRRAPK